MGSEKSQSTAQTASPETMFRPVVVIPTYNNAKTLMDVIRRAEVSHVPVIVVDDGSTDETPALLADWRGHGHVVTHETNMGKASALQTGFIAARKQGFTHAITLDSDGQLAPEQVSDFVDAARAHPTDFIIGNRNDLADDYPTRSRVGRRLQNLAVRVECGATVADTLCGFRAYPLAMFDFVRARAGGFAFEIEIVTRAVWAGYQVRSVPIRCRYFAAGEGVSHYRFVRDWTHALLVHIYLLFRRLSPWPVRRAPHARRSTISFMNLVRQLVCWLRPDVLWMQIRSSHLERTVAGATMGLGVFAACLPAFGIQISIGIYCAIRFYSASFLSLGIGLLVLISPIGIALHIASFWIGHIVLLGLIPLPTDVVAALTPAGVTVTVVLRWLIGGLILGGFLGAVVGSCINVLMSRIPYARDLKTSSITVHS